MIVVDTGPLIALAKLDLLPLLPTLYGAVHLPQTVLQECTAQPSRPDAAAIQRFIDASARVHPDASASALQQLTVELDAGEAQALYLAQSLDARLLIDDLAGRRVAKRYGLSVVGVVGILLLAKKRQHLKTIAPRLAALAQAHYRVSTTLCAEALRLAGET